MHGHRLSDRNPANRSPIAGASVFRAVAAAAYTSGDTETPYETPVTMLWHPYQQSLLKGDAPIIGQDIFLDLTGGDRKLSLKAGSVHDAERQ